MGTYTKNLKLETPNYTDNADIPALTKKNNEIIDSEMIKRANGLDYNEQTGVLQLTGNNSKVGSPIQIKNNLPVTSMSSGTELKVNNYKQLIKFTKEGKTEQKTCTGKNLLNYVDNLQSINGLTNTLNPDGSITTTGKPTANFARIVKNYDITNFLEDKQVYTISQEKLNRKVFIQISAKKKDGTYTYYDSRAGKLSFTVDKSLYTNYSIVIQTPTMSVWGDSSLTITNKYMLYKGTDTADTSFEPYVGGQPSPNPDYPQQIENIEGVENIWFGGESTTNNGITFTKNADGSYDITGTATAEANCFNYINIANTKLKNGINYNLSINKLTNGKVIILTEAYANETWDSHVINALNTSNSFLTNKIINIKDNITRVCYGIRVEKGQTVNIKGLKIQLEEGTITHTFVLPGSNYLQLKNTTDNEAKTISIDLKGNELCSNKEQTLKDELIIENGRAKIIKKYDEYVFTGNEGFGFADNNTKINTDSTRLSILSKVYIETPNKNTNVTPLFCTHYRPSTQLNTKPGSNTVAFASWNGTICFYFPADYSTIDEFKAKLKSLYDAGTPVKVQYQLAEPKVIDLGEVDFDLIENSTLTCEEESDMQIDYLTIDSNIFVQDSLDGNSSQKAPSVKAVNNIINQLEARIKALESK